MNPRPGQAAIAAKGWWRAHRFLLARRTVQFGILGLFALGPLAGVWIIQGNLSASMTLDVLPLADVFLVVQSLFAGHMPALTAVIGAAIIAVFYFLVGGRAYCAWVCPVNIVTDGAGWLRRRLNLSPGAHFKRATRFWLLGAALAVAALTGVAAWELVNPVSMLHRGLLFGFGLAWTVVAAVFLFDLLIARRGWCGHLCPMGAFYSLIGTKSPLRVRAVNRAQCDDCMDCYGVCPEPQVITPVLKGAARGAGPVILSPQCTNCGRCIDVCTQDVFAFSTRYSNVAETSS
ncbi:MAG TPA: quinol dehydrogenase ferredoxin subunit NapH [Acidiferrobacterales bacterium]